MEQVSKKMMEELEVFKQHPFHVAMEWFNEEQFPELEYYRCTHGIDNDFNVFLKIIKHITGDLQFEEEKPKKYVVRTKERDRDGDYWFIIEGGYGFCFLTAYGMGVAVKFDTREEAEKWTNPQTEVVEVAE